jgi:hypothetical protein
MFSKVLNKDEEMDMVIGYRVARQFQALNIVIDRRLTSVTQWSMLLLVTVRAVHLSAPPKKNTHVV